MIKKLNEVAKKAYCPYSNFHVASIFEMEDGSIYSGFNIENASYPSGMCAERVALYSMINDQINIKNVKIIHIFSPNSKIFLSPCGGCRQTLTEHIELNTEIKMYNKNGEFISKKLVELIPYPVISSTIKGN